MMYSFFSTLFYAYFLPHIPDPFVTLFPFYNSKATGTLDDTSASSDGGGERLDTREGDSVTGTHVSGCTQVEVRGRNALGM